MPKVEKKPRKLVTDKNEGLVLACRRKQSIESLIQQPPVFRSMKTTIRSKDQKYKEFISKHGNTGRTVLLYDDQPSWHQDLDKTIKNFGRDQLETIVNQKHTCKFNNE